MSAQIQIPTFDGSDSADAEDFIHAIRAKAFAEGKDTDQKWILRLVAASLTRQALRWHTTLDPAIQNDWTLLQKALLARFCETFKGIDGVECERFIHSIRRKGFEEGRTGDNEWITTFVATYVVEDALRWHASLAPEIRNDWELLQTAMLSRYPPPDVRERPLKSPMIPIPASAAPAPPSPKKGRIRYVDPGNPTLQTYLSKAPLTAGNLVATQSQSEALVVEYDSGGSPNSLTVKNLTTGGFDLLGMKWYYAGVPDLSSTSDQFARPVGCSHPPSGQITTSYSGANGTAHVDIWDVSSDGKITMTWTHPNGSKIPIYPRRQTNMANDIIIAGPASKYDASSYTRGSFVLEAC